MKRILARGFTLVELLIVIALLGVIATIVIAAINPIEQANKARDAGYKNDASELISAVQRFYASENEFPWSVCPPSSTTCSSPTYSKEDPVPWTSADDPVIGLCGTGTCKTNAVSSDGVLITSLELQSSFLSKTWIGAAKESDKIYIGKGPSSSDSPYACWIPASNTNKQTLINNGEVVNLESNIGESGVPTYGGCTTTGAPGWNPGSNTPGGSSVFCAECVPE